MIRRNVSTISRSDLEDYAKAQEDMVEKLEDQLRKALNVVAEHHKKTEEKEKS